LIKALEVAKKNLKGFNNCKFYQASIERIPIKNNSMDFGYSLGVLHHIPDTFAGIKSCVEKLKRGAPFLAYIYYAFDNKPLWFKALWQLSDIIRKIISKLPFRLKLFISQIIAVCIYYHVARTALILEKMGLNVKNFPLSIYRNMPFYSMQTDALDRFGTRLEKRFTRGKIYDMFKRAGLENITFHDEEPYWCALGHKKDKNPSN
jgi:SAM-dependent methyltransferase